MSKCPLPYVFVLRHVASEILKLVDILNVLVVEGDWRHNLKFSYRRDFRLLATNAVITIAIRLRYDYDTTTIRL